MRVHFELSGTSRKMSIITIILPAPGRLETQTLGIRLVPISEKRILIFVTTGSSLRHFDRGSASSIG